MGSPRQPFERDIDHTPRERYQAAAKVGIAEARRRLAETHGESITPDPGETDGMD